MTNFDGHLENCVSISAGGGKRIWLTLVGQFAPRLVFVNLIGKEGQDCLCPAKKMFFSKAFPAFFLQLSISRWKKTMQMS